MTPEAVSAIVRHCEEANPEEAVGILAGARPDCADTVIPLPNLANPGAFLADPHAQYRAEKRLEAEGQVVVGVYHSHPGGTPTLSPADVTFAAKGLPHLVIGTEPSLGMRAFVCVGRRVLEVKIQLSEQSGP